MFGKKSKPRPSGGGGGGSGQSRNNDLVNMMGLGMPPMDDADDDDLLAELAALQGNPKAAQKKAKPKKAVVSMEQIEKMAAENMKDIDEMDDDSDIDEGELLAELEDIAGSDDEDDNEEDNEKQDTSSKAPSGGNNMVRVLNERKTMYETAIKNAKAEGSSSKARRFERGLKEIVTLLKKAEKGGAVAEDDIPPPVSIKVSKPIDPQTQTLPGPSSATDVRPVSPIQKFGTPDIADQPMVVSPPKPTPQPVNTPPPTQHDPQPSTSSQVFNEVGNETLTKLLDRQKQFKILALKMKHEGNMEEARKYMVTAKQFDSVIEAAKEGKDIDLANMPELPHDQPKRMEESHQSSSNVAPAASSSQQHTPSNDPPAQPKTVLEALQQRLAIYEASSQKAKEEGNGSKARRMGRISKQYQDAIKAHKSNRPVNFNELPTPPGVGPIPGVSSPQDDNANDMSAQPGPSTAPAIQTQPKQSPPQAQIPSIQTEPPPKIVKTRNQKEHEFLLTRQKEFKAAALRAKQSGDIEAARDYLRQGKSLDQMIVAAENGLKVDLTTVPSVQKKASGTSPQSSNEVVGFKQPVSFTGSNAEQYIQLETALRKQIEASQKNSQHYHLLGNLDAAKNFESLLNSSKKDLEALLYCKKHRTPVPNCNYIMKSFPVIRSNPELSDSELEITIVRCINIPLPSGWQPKDMYTYVTYEFPYPQEKPQSNYTTTKKETINPEFNESFKVSIERKNRSFIRFCKRQSCNLKVNYVRGFLKSDKALGQASIKLEKFYNKCEIHESLDLLDLERGRKSVGGKIEVMLKIREPLVDKDAEIVKEKWLVLDTHLRSLEMKTQDVSPQPKHRQGAYDCLEVVKYEKEVFEKQYKAYKAQGHQPPPALIEKIKLCNGKMMSIQNRLKENGRDGVIEYYENLINGINIEKQKAHQALQLNNKDVAKECLVKKKLLEKEITSLKHRLGLK